MKFSSKFLAAAPLKSAGAIGNDPFPDGPSDFFEPLTNQHSERVASADEKATEKVVTLYHGTCPDSAKALCENGWQPNQVTHGGNGGQSRYLYLTTGIEDAQWFANEKGCDTVLEVRDIPLSYLEVDPEDGSFDTLEEELSHALGTPGKVVLTHSLPASHFHLFRNKTGQENQDKTAGIKVPDGHGGSIDIGTPRSKYEKACFAIANDDKLFDHIATYVAYHPDALDDYPEDTKKLIEVISSIPPFRPSSSRGCLYRGEPENGRGYIEERGIKSWSLNWATAAEFARDCRGVVKQTVGKIQGVALSDIVTWRMRVRQGESHYSGMQAEWFVLNNCKTAIVPSCPEGAYNPWARLSKLASKPKCPHCGSSDYGLMPSDFETAKCHNCGKNWEHGIVPGINDPKTAAKGWRYVRHYEIAKEWGWNDPRLISGPNFDWNLYQHLLLTGHPDLLYHETSPKYREQILKEGLKKEWYDSQAVYLSTKGSQTTQGDLWEVNVKGLEVEPDDTTPLDESEWEQLGAPWWCSEKSIPADRLKLVMGKIASRVHDEDDFNPLDISGLPLGERVHSGTVLQYVTALHADRNAERFDEEGMEGESRITQYHEFVLKLVNLSEIDSPWGVADETVDEFVGLTTPAPPVVLDAEGTVIDGSHRVEAALERGETQIRAFVPVVGKTASRPNFWKLFDRWCEFREVVYTHEYDEREVFAEFIKRAVPRAFEFIRELIAILPSQTLLFGAGVDVSAINQHLDTAKAKLEKADNNRRTDWTRHDFVTGINEIGTAYQSFAGNTETLKTSSLASKCTLCGSEKACRCPSWAREKQAATTPQQPQQSQRPPLTEAEMEKLVNDVADRTQQPFIDPTTTPEFKAWFGRSVVRNRDGSPKLVYHGTTHDFDTFKLDKADPENYYGKAFYFTDSREDVNANYSSVSGPDLTLRIGNRIDRIMEELQYGGEDEASIYSDMEQKELYDIAEQRAKKELVGTNQGVVYLTYLRIENPVIVTPNGGTMFELEWNEDTDEESGSAARLGQAVNKVAQQWGCEGDFWGQIREQSGLDEQFSAHELEHALRNREHYLSYAYEDDDDKWMAKFCLDLWKTLGFDGIVLDANAAFAKGDMLSAMPMDRGTKHYIVWNPRQIKSALSNRNFNRRSPKITASRQK